MLALRRPIMCMVSGQKCRPRENGLSRYRPPKDMACVLALTVFEVGGDAMASLSGAFPEWT